MQSCLTAKMLEKLQGGAENLFAQLPKHQYFLFDGFFFFGKAENFACQPLKST